MSRTEMAELLGVSRKTLYKHLGRLETGKESPQPVSSPKKAEKPKTNGGRTKSKPPPGPHKSAFKKGNPGGPGAPKGNDNATKAGEHRNPFLHFVPAEDARLVTEQAEKSTTEKQRDSVAFYDARLLDMTRRMAKLQAVRKDMVTVEAEYTRQEGKGEGAITYRQGRRRRQRLDDKTFELHEAVTRTQSKRDAAVAKLHDMEQVEKGARKKGLADVLAGMRQGGDDDE